MPNYQMAVTACCEPYSEITECSKSCILKENVFNKTIMNRKRNL